MITRPFRRSLALIIALATLLPAVPAHAANCQYVLGFKALHDLIPQVVGDCLVDEHHNPTNGDGLQETTKGLLAWRKLDNWTAFTDGYRTWVNGPYGIQKRLNTQRFPWEGDAASYPVVGGSAPFAPQSTPTPSTTSSQSTAISFTMVQGGTPGSYATVSIHTAPGTSCAIDYVTPYGTDSSAAGLVSKTADGNGNVTWTWKIGTRTYLGTGTVTVSCGGQSASGGITIG